MADEINPIRIVIGDDHALVLDGLRGLLGSETDLFVVAAAMDGERLLDAVHRFRPHLVVMDVQMPGMDGLACLKQIRAEGLPVRVLMLSAFSDAHTMRAAVESARIGFALKTDPPRATLTAVRQVAAGQLVFPQAARRWLTTSAPEPGALTEREEAVFALVAEGKSNAEIAAAMDLRETTVKFHLRNLFAKLGVTNRTEAAARFHRRG